AAPADPQGAPGLRAGDYRQTLYPLRWVQTTIGAFGAGSVAGPIALILGVLVAGGEFGWATLKTVFTQRPGRVAAMVGKMCALAGILGVLVAALFAATALCSMLIGIRDGTAGVWPGPL